MSMPENITIGEKYGSAMEVQTEAEALAYWERCVEHSMRWHDREKAEEVEAANIGYYTGYYDRETAERVFRLYPDKVSHPVFGKSRPTPEEAFEAGKAMAS